MKNKKLSWAVLASIFLSCLLVAILQGTAFFYTKHITKVFLLSLLFSAMGAFASICIPKSFSPRITLFF